jgi:hypothetical protein
MGPGDVEGDEPMPCLGPTRAEWAAAEARIRELELQVGELQNILWEIGKKDVSEPFSRDDAMKILTVLNKTGFVEKRICVHEWAHIEDHHVICRKCKHTADLCWTCEEEETKTRDGGLVCLKCNPQ